MDKYGLSRRGASNVEAIWPRISKAVVERERAEKNPIIDLGTSENWLLRPELVEIYKKAIHDELSGQHLSYPNGFAGDTDLLDALSQFLNCFFKPFQQVEAEHLATAPGAAFCLDALLYNICEAGDGILVPTPCWNGFDWLLSVKAGVQPIFVAVDGFDDIFTSKLITKLEEAYAQSTRPVRGLLFTNPQNPFGQCYPSTVITAVLHFCNDKKIHFISDEIYALSRFNCPDIPSPEPFVSTLQLDLEALSIDISRVHIIWSLSKDFGSSGLRMGCCITQRNKPLRTGLALVSNTQMSSLTAIAATNLLRTAQPSRLLALNTERLGAAYMLLTSVLKERNIPYIPSNMCPFLFARIAPRANSWADEAEAIQLCKAAGVSLSAGRSYHLLDGEMGWARINFAMPSDVLTEALRRLALGLDSILEHGQVGPC